MDENECQEELHNCHINSKCLNELGSFRCICDDNFVDNAALNNQRPGTDCQNPCFTSFDSNSTISGKSKMYLLSTDWKLGILKVVRTDRPDRPTEFMIREV